MPILIKNMCQPRWVSPGIRPARSVIVAAHLIHIRLARRQADDGTFASVGDADN